MAMEKHFIQEGKIRSEMDSFLRKDIGKAVYCGMNIHKTPLAVRINLYVEKPPIVIGKKGRRIKKLTKTLEEKYDIENLAIDVQRVEDPVLNPEVIAKRVATALEKRMYRRRVVYRAIRAIMGAGAKGVEITLSGKIFGKGGRSRREKYSEGYMKKAGDSTKLVREGSTQAYLKAGVIGVTVKIVPRDVVFPDDISVKPAEEEEPEEKKEKKAEKKEKEAGPSAGDVGLYSRLLEGSIKDFKKGVSDLEDVDFEKIIELEKEGKNRKTLLSWLESRVD